MLKLSVLFFTLLFSLSSNAHISIDKIKEIRSDKKVVNLRSGQYLYTLTPSNLFEDPKLQLETLKQFQTFVTSMTKNWHVEIAKVLDPQLSKYSPSELEKLSFEEFNRKLKSGEIKLTSYEIIEGVHKSQDPKKATKDMNKIQNDLDKFLQEYNLLIDSLSEEAEVYGSYSNQAWYKKLSHYLWEQKFPDAFVVTAGGKFTDGITAKMKESPYKPIRFLAPLTLGGVNFSYIGKYWQVLETNLNTGQTKSSWYREGGFQIWYAKDILEGGLQKVSKNFRLGAGFIWGNVERVEDYSGGYGGISKSFPNCPVSSLLSFFKIPFVNRMPNCHVKAGVIGPGAIDFITNNTEIPSIYVITSLEGGLQTAAANKPHLNLGAVTQFYDLKEVYDAVSPDEYRDKALDREIPDENTDNQAIDETNRVLRPNSDEVIEE